MDLLLKEIGAVNGVAEDELCMAGKPVMPGVDIGGNPGLFLAAVERGALGEAVAQVGRYMAGVDVAVVDDEHT